MSSLLGYISDGIGLVIAVLYTVAGTAHFTDRFTPELAANVETMTQNSSQAFGFLGLSYIQLKQTFGAFDLLGAACLWWKPWRRTGLVLAVVGFAGGLYGQLVSGGDVSQVGGLLGAAIVGLACSLSRRP